MKGTRAYPDAVLFPNPVFSPHCQEGTGTRATTPAVSRGEGNPSHC